MSLNIDKKSKISIILNNNRFCWPMVLGNFFKDDYTWPRITLVTPSFNQSKYLEQTILSVLGQAYPNLEYFIIDGGSIDGSIDIINKYKNRIYYWTSEPDGGQSSAINKGLKMASGDIVGWINSDDILLPNTLWKIGLLFRKLKDVMACSGNEICIAADGEVTNYKKLLPLNTKWLLAIGNFSQPTIFWKRELINIIGFLDENLHYSMDYDYFLRISSVTDIYHIQDYLVAFRYHAEQKTSTNLNKSKQECAKISAPYIEKLFQDDKEFQRYCNICRLKEAFWYLKSGQFKMMIHPLKRFFYRGWRQ